MNLTAQTRVLMAENTGDFRVGVEVFEHVEVRGVDVQGPVTHTPG
jgi:hypothetical protein